MPEPTVNMNIDRAITVLDLFKPIAKVVPGVGNYLEGVVDLLLLGCNYTQVGVSTSCWGEV